MKSNFNHQVIPIHIAVKSQSHNFWIYRLFTRSANDTRAHMKQNKRIHTLCSWLSILININRCSRSTLKSHSTGYCRVQVPPISGHSHRQTTKVCGQLVYGNLLRLIVRGLSTNCTREMRLIDFALEYLWS